jgi:hypothetical protein
MTHILNLEAERCRTQNPRYLYVKTGYTTPWMIQRQNKRLLDLRFRPNYNFGHQAA